MVHFNLGFIQLQLRCIMATVMIMTTISGKDVRPFNRVRDNERGIRGLGGRGPRARWGEKYKHYKNRAKGAPGAAHRGEG